MSRARRPRSLARLSAARRRVRLPFRTDFIPIDDRQPLLTPSAGGGRAGEATHRRRREEGRRITSDLTDSWRSVDRRRRRYRAATCSRFSVLSPSLSSLVIDTLSPQNEGTGERANEQAEPPQVGRELNSGERDGAMDGWKDGWRQRAEGEGRKRGASERASERSPLLLSSPTGGFPATTIIAASPSKLPAQSGPIVRAQLQT